MNALANAKALARHGFMVFPSVRELPDFESVATSDLTRIEQWGKRYVDAIWMVRCVGGLVVISSQEFETLSAELGEAPMTLHVARTGGGGDVRWYRCEENATVKLGSKSKKATVIPGSKHPSGETYEVQDGVLFAVGRIARLPDAWVDAIAPSGITTANFVPKYEFNSAEFLRWRRHARMGGFFE